MTHSNKGKASLDLKQLKVGALKGREVLCCTWGGGVTHTHTHIHAHMPLTSSPLSSAVADMLD